MQRKSLPQGRLLWQHRAIRQADSARDFSSSQGLKREGILYVFQTFQTAGLTEKIRRSAKTQLCGVALQFSQRDPRGILRTHAQRIPVEDRQQLQPRVRAGGKLAVRRKDDRLRQGGKAAAGVFEPALLRAPEVKKRRFAARAQPFGLLRREKPPRERQRRCACRSSPTGASANAQTQRPPLCEMLKCSSGAAGNQGFPCACRASVQSVSCGAASAAARRSSRCEASGPSGSGAA